MYVWGRLEQPQRLPGSAARDGACRRDGRELPGAALRKRRGKIAFKLLCDPLIERGRMSSGRSQSHKLCNSVFHEGASPSLQVQE